MEEELEVSPEAEKRWRDSLRISDKELLAVFPEAKTIIPQKLKEWQEHKKELSKIIREILKLIKTRVKDKFSRWFWREYWKYENANELLEIRQQIARLKRLSRVPEGKEIKGAITEQQIIKAREYPIENLIDQPLRKSGKYLKGLCPFHQEKTPSYFIFPDNKFKCFGCGEAGDAISFIQKQRGLNFAEAIKALQ